MKTSQPANTLARRVRAMYNAHPFPNIPEPPKNIATINVKIMQSNPKNV